MAKKTITTEDLLAAAQTVARELPDNPTAAGALVRLQLSDVVTIADSAVSFRTGHLENIANLYAGDPASTERDYADDLAVARAYCREQWEALIAPSQT